MLAWPAAVGNGRHWQDEDLQRFLHSRKITTADNLRVVMNEIAQTLRHEELVSRATAQYT